MTQERRRFERKPLNETALALDESGREIGRVTVQGDGGMLIQIGPGSVAANLRPGQNLRVTVVMPGHQDRKTRDVIVRDVQDTAVGVEFVPGAKAT